MPSRFLQNAGSRRGFTALEMLMTLVVASLVMATVAPKFQVARESTSVRSAQQEVAAYLSTAKAAAVRRGTNARFHISGNKISVAVQENGTWTPVTGHRDLQSEYKVTLVTGVTNIVFDSRGFAWGLASNTEITAMRSGKTQKVCVTRAGAIVRGGCTL